VDSRCLRRERLMGDKEHLGDLLKSFMPWVKELKGEIVISGYMLSWKCTVRFVSIFEESGKKGSVRS
jgi:hypothetical protein